MVPLKVVRKGKNVPKSLPGDPKELMSAPSILKEFLKCKTDVTPQVSVFQHVLYKGKRQSRLWVTQRGIATMMTVMLGS